MPVANVVVTTLKMLKMRVLYRAHIFFNGNARFSEGEAAYAVKIVCMMISAFLVRFERRSINVSFVPDPSGIGCILKVLHTHPLRAIKYVSTCMTDCWAHTSRKRTAALSNDVINLQKKKNLKTKSGRHIWARYMSTRVLVCCCARFWHSAGIFDHRQTAFQRAWHFGQENSPKSLCYANKPITDAVATHIIMQAYLGHAIIMELA